MHARGNAGRNGVGVDIVGGMVGSAYKAPLYL